MAREWLAVTMAAVRRMVCVAGRMVRATVDRKVRHPLRGVTFIDRVCKDFVVGHRHLRGEIIVTAAMVDRILLAAMVPTDREHATVSADRQVGIVSATGRDSQNQIEMAAVQVVMALDRGDLAAAQDR
jgi:hypothetical protein